MAKFTLTVESETMDELLTTLQDAAVAIKGQEEPPAKKEEPKKKATVKKEPAEEPTVRVGAEPFGEFEPQGQAVEDAPAKEEPAKEEPAGVTLEEVRVAVGAWSVGNAKRTAKVSGLLTKLGHKKLSDVPASELPAFIELTKEAD